MMHCRVDGTVVTAAAHKSLEGWRLVICQPIDDTGEDVGEPVIAIDPYMAGLHQRVYVTTDGIGTRTRVHDDKSPLRNMVMGIIDDAQ